ncbi:hypothetical protein NX784_28345 [Massilia pinisoli]|uniref:Transmembrane protein n=1 Tax=Massilia pinisoli TaxID=1772194 RepID=A0ABT1ZZY3_9BURK|nr:hypothetical protein [Massilia pinisoli]MCS0585497.1 hypothetical protein [Massilia pinisoli]
MTTRLFAAAALCLLFAGCSPKYNWRDYASLTASYHVTFPSKPSTVTRTIDLDGMQVSLTMTAAEVDGATFAVGSAEAPDAARAQAALEAMQVALVRNINATVTHEKVTAGDDRATRDVDAKGTDRGAPVRLVGHFESRGKNFYQVIVLGRPKALPDEQVEQFLTSFKLP